MTPSPIILFATRVAPDPAGTLDARKSWWLLQALAASCRVHLVLLHRPRSRRQALKSLLPARPVCVSVTPIMTSAASYSQLASIATQVPLKNFDCIFAPRPAVSGLFQELVERAWISSHGPIVDYDDQLDSFRVLEQKDVEPLLDGRARMHVESDAWNIRSHDPRP